MIFPRSAWSTNTVKIVFWSLEHGLACGCGIIIDYPIPSGNPLTTTEATIPTAVAGIAPCTATQGRR